MEFLIFDSDCLLSSHDFRDFEFLVLRHYLFAVSDFFLWVFLRFLSVCLLSLLKLFFIEKRIKFLVVLVCIYVIEAHKPATQRISIKLAAVQAQQLIYRAYVTRLNEHVSWQEGPVLLEHKWHHLRVLKVRHLFVKELVEVFKFEMLRKVCNAQIKVLFLVLKELFLHLVLCGHYMLVDYCLPLQSFIFLDLF